MKNHQSSGAGSGRYHRYHIHTREIADIVPWPSRFKVDVNRLGLAKLLIKESWEYRLDPQVVMSRPCVYGVFSGPVGGFAPREAFCVGCLRCTIQYPDWVEIRPNPKRAALGDSYFSAEFVNTVTLEAQTGQVPVRGAGYRGRFGGPGWDGMWTDMSEIVRPTRDGIHGREFISTAVDIGSKPSMLAFDAAGQPVGALPNTFSLPLPMLFDVPPHTVTSAEAAKALAQAAEAIDTIAMLPIQVILDNNLRGDHIAPVVSDQDLALLKVLPSKPRLLVIDGWAPSVDPDLHQQVADQFPGTLIGLRTPFHRGQDLLDDFAAGQRVFHLTANYHGRGADDQFVLDQIREVHGLFVSAGVREEVTLLGSGGIIAAEHVPKAIIAGLDAVVLNSPLMVAMQASFIGEFRNRRSLCKLPKKLTADWGAQRLQNLMASWRDQLLEILGAMGMREVRRLRGEIGRAMFQVDLERDAFGDIEGYS
jgi:hypothetical protein